MGTSASENIAIQISTAYDGSGTTAAAKDLSTLATAGKGAAGALADASKSATAVATSAVQTAGLGPAFEKWAAGALKAGASLESLEKQWVANQAATARLAATQQAWLAQLPPTTAAQTQLGQAAAAAAAATTQAAVATSAAAQSGTAQSTALAAVTSQTKQATAATAGHVTQMQKLPPQLKTASNALGLLAQAAVTGQGSISGLANAMGNAAQSAASMSNSAKIVAGATGIGALITVAGVALGGFDAWTKKTRELDAQLKGLQSTGRSLSATIGGNDLEARLEQMRQAAEEQRRRLEDLGIFERAVEKFFGLFTDDQREKERAAQIAQINTNLAKSAELLNVQVDNEEKARAVEKRRLIENGTLALNMERMRAQAASQFTIVKTKESDDLLRSYAEQFGQAKSSFDLQKEQIAVQERQRAREIEQQFERRDAAGAIIDLTIQETAQRAILLKQNEAMASAQRLQLEAERQRAVTGATLEAAGLSDSFGTRFRARLEQIEQEQQAQVEAIGDVQAVADAAELKKRALYRETARQASADAKTLFEAFRSSSDKTLKAIGTFGENLRRIAIGAEAARAAVRAAVETGEAIASAAVGDLAGAALHGAAALQLGAAAALGFRESLGGGGGGGASGGGGGAPTFTPRDSGGGGAVTVNLYTVDPLNGENIRKVAYFLQRNGTLKVPIYPTTGLVGAVA